MWCYALLKMIKIEELTSELIAFLDSIEQYQTFIDWGEERGHNVVDLENSVADNENF